MRKLIERITRLRATAPCEGVGSLTGEQTEEKEAERKLPPDPSLFFMLSHLEDDGPVRMDGVKLGVCEVMGLEIDEPKLGAFAGALNACDFPFQLLIRQHPPRLGGLRTKLNEAQPEDLPPQTEAAAESLGRLLTELESRDGVLDRRFYAVCEFPRIEELRGLLARAGVSVHPLKGRQLRMFLVSAALGGTPAEFDGEATVEVEINRRDVRIGDRLVRSLHLGKWPRSLAPGFLQGLMAAGAPMDLSIHLGSIPAEQAARTLEWQKVRFESAQSLSLKRGRSLSPEAEIALEDVTRLRDDVQRGRERLFHSSLSVTLHAKDEDSLKDMTQRAKGHFAANPGQARQPLLQAEGRAAFDAAAGTERRCDVADAGHVVSGEALSLLAARPRHEERHPLRDRHARLRPGGLRPLGRHASQRKHRSAGPLRLGKIILDQIGGAQRPDARRNRLRDRPGGRVRRHGPRRGRTGAVSGCPRPGHESLRHRQGRLRGAPPAHRQPASPHRGDGGRAIERRAPRLSRSRAGGILCQAPRAHRVPRLLRVPAARRGGRPGHREAAQALRHRESSQPALRRGRRPAQQRGTGHRLRPASAGAGAPSRAAMVCTETVWAAAAQDPKPRLLVVDEVWSIMQHPEGAAFMVSMAKRARKHRLGLQFITQDVQDLLSEDSSRAITGHSGRALLQNAAFKLLLQQDAAAISTVGDAFDVPEDLQRWLLSCPRGDGLLLSKGHRFPVRIEATPEETAVIEWRPGRH